MMATRWIIAMFALVIVAPGPTAAEDDGGGRSVFATGAGNRALSLGGAYAAFANDASAPLWNPAGLGLVTRREFQVSHTSYYGIGINEQYASFVLPSWRWGAASLTFRHFGVGGIELRDERNAVLGEDVSDSEMEIAVGYGRRMGNAWSLGGVVKVQRQSLAGFTDAGIGVDLGATVKPFSALYPNSAFGDRFSLGVFARNVVQPTLRLAEANVSDPSGIRVGLGYTLPIGYRSVILAMDVEKTRTMNTRLHSGLEFVVHPLLRLRAGVNSGVVTAGTGINWNNITVDYAFENTGLDQVHRIGASFSFGKTVDESRRADRDAQESALQAQLAQAFEASQAKRIADLFEQAQRARTAGDFNEALRLVGVVATLDPDNTEAHRRHVAYLCDMAGLLESQGDFAEAAVTYSRAVAVDPDFPGAQNGFQRCRARSNQVAARSDEIRVTFDHALDAFSRRDFVAARNGFQKILAEDADDTEAAAMLARTNDAIDREVAHLLDYAGRMIEWRHLDEAQKSLASVRGLGYAGGDLEDVTARLARARSDEQNADTGAQSTPTVAAATLTDEQKKEADHLYQQGMDALSARRADDAVKYWELVWLISPDWEKVSENLNKEYLRMGMEFFADGRLDRAVAMWESALRVAPDDERTKGYLSRAREQMTRTREILGGSR